MDTIKSYIKGILRRNYHLAWFLFQQKKNIKRMLHRNSLKIQCKGIAKLKNIQKGQIII